MDTFHGKKVSILGKDGIIGQGVISSIEVETKADEGTDIKSDQTGVEFSLDIEMTDRQMVDLLWALLTQQQIRMQADSVDD